MTNSFTDKDLGYTRVINELTLIDDTGVEVGFIGEDRYPSGVPIALVAAWHEGEVDNDRIPNRPFLGPTMDRHRQEYGRVMRRGITRILDGHISLENFLAVLGERTTADVKQMIIEVKVPPNSPATIRKKGSSNPLIDTGTMLANVTYRVSIK